MTIIRISAAAWAVLVIVGGLHVTNVSASSPRSTTPSQGRSTSLEALLSKDAAPLLAGASTRVITPSDFERFEDLNEDAVYQPDSEPFYDTGVDRRYDPEEPGAFGPDGQPGVAGLDDDGNGIVDDASEYLTSGSDDKYDPSGDNYHPTSNPDGTENNGVFESVALAGFQGFLGMDIRPMQGVHDDLYARALAINKGSTTVVLIVVDLIGIQFHFMNPVKRDLETNYGVPFDNTIIAATHTHQGPDTVGIWAGKVDADYMDFVMDQMYRAAAEALGRLEPASLTTATARPMACYDKETLVMFPEPSCDLADYETANLDSSSSYDQYILQNDLRDPWVRRMEVPVMRLAAEDGATIAVLANFDDHPEVFLDENNLCSSDFPNYVREALEDAFGGIGIYVSGTLGCQMGALRGAPIPFRDANGQPEYQPGIYDVEGNPFPACASSAEDRVRSLGFVIGDYAVQALEGASPVPAPDLAIATEYVDVSLDNPFYRLLIRVVERSTGFAEDEYVVHAPWCSLAGCLRTPVSVVNLGGAVFVTAPGEFPPEYVTGRSASVAPYSEVDPSVDDYDFPGMPSLYDEIGAENLFFIGLANNYFGYAIPASDTLSFEDSDHPNFYEEEYDTSLCFGDSIGNRLLEMVGSSKRFGSCEPHP